MRYRFSEKFETQLERALRGYSPWKKENQAYIQKAMAKKAPSEKQIEWLTKFNEPIPETMAEASTILDRCFGKTGG